MLLKNPKFDLKAQSKTVFEQALVLSVAMVTMMFLCFQTFEVTAYEGVGEQTIVDIEEIPETEQMKKPPPPQRPQIPIATESEDIPEDVTIMDTEVDLNAPPPPPPPPPGAGRTDESPVFFAWEEAPEVLKMVMPEYPEIARKAGVEGMVILTIIVDEQGNVIQADIVVEEPLGIFGQAAIDAVMQYKFKPARQRDKPIKVQMGHKIIFTLQRTRPPPGGMYE